MRYFIVALVLLSCWCKNTTVKAIAVLEKTNGESFPLLQQDQPIYLPTDDVHDAPILKPRILAQPAILVAKQPLPLVLPPKDTQDSPITQPKVLSQPAVVVEERPLVPVVLPVLASDTASPIANVVVTPSNKPAANIAACARPICPRIYCPNSLPAIPSQGICCPRCIFNPECKAKVCPKLNCSSRLTPANLTAGECCDRCAPLLSKTTATTQAATTTTPEAKTSKKDTSSSEERNSSEEPSECNKKTLNTKLNKKYSRLIRLLTKTIAQLRRSNKNQAREESDEVQDN